MPPSSDLYGCVRLQITRPDGCVKGRMNMPNSPDMSIMVSRTGSVRWPWRRLRLVPCAAGLAAAILAVAGCSSAPSSAGATATQYADSASPSWHIVKRVANDTNGGFTAVTAVGQDGGWAFYAMGTLTAKPTAWERNGLTWTQVPFPGLREETVVAAAASSATDVWAFTSEFGKGTSRALRWNGRYWTVVRSFSRGIGGAVVLSPSDVWVFGQPYQPGADLGAWHYNGRTWSQVASGQDLEGGSGLSASDIWAFDGADVAHWNGSTWSRTSVASLLPATQRGLNDPALAGIYEQSTHSVYAIANGNEQASGGPLAILHWNGSAWSKVAGGGRGYGGPPSSDGHGGLWLATDACCGGGGYVLHYSAGHLTQAAVPGGPERIQVDAVAHIPGTAELLVVGDTHPYPDENHFVGVILLYRT
jgi:hypothetical protein